jgi:hypothetical protein
VVGSSWGESLVGNGVVSQQRERDRGEMEGLVRLAAKREWGLAARRTGLKAARARGEGAGGRAACIRGVAGRLARGPHGAVGFWAGPM